MTKNVAAHPRHPEVQKQKIFSFQKNEKECMVSANQRTNSRPATKKETGNNNRYINTGSNVPIGSMLDDSFLSAADWILNLMTCIRCANQINADIFISLPFPACPYHSLPGVTFPPYHSGSSKVETHITTFRKSLFL